MRSFNRRVGLTWEEEGILADWLSRDPEAKDLLIRWALMTTDKEFGKKEVTEMTQGMIKSMALTLLERYEHWREEKEKICGG